MLTVSGFHATLDTRTAIPRPFLAYYPALIAQADISETINFLNSDGIASFNTGHPIRYEPLGARESYDPNPAEPFTGPTKSLPLGDIALARSGDKGGNLNFGIFPKKQEHWSWLCSYMTISRMQDLLGHDWQEEFYIERVEFPRIQAVHFLIYGILGRGVSSSSRLDGFGKGFADYIRDKVVDVPVCIL